MELSKTEFKISAYVTAGYDAKEIARKLFRSYYTIATQIKNIRIKNDLKNMAEISREFVLEFGDPRKYVAMILMVLHLGFGLNTNVRKVRKVNRRYARTSKVMKSNINYVISA